jgi:DNA modification methylase
VYKRQALGNKSFGDGNKNIVQNDDKSDWREAWKLFEGNIVYVWHASKFSDVVMESIRDSGFEIIQQIIWNKSMLIMGRSDYHFKHEPCWYAVRKNKKHDWIGDRKQTTVIDAKSPNRLMSGSEEFKSPHPTQKPSLCMSELIKNHSGDVYDPFLGSGTTMVAAEQLNRKCYGMEIDPKYCAVILERMSDMGLTPELVSNAREA